MITVYYDGKCGLCSKEINYYKRIAPPNIFNWHDITRDAETFTQKGYLLTDGLKALHAEDAEGHMHIGVDAFILIWKQLKYWRYLGFCVGLPGIRHLANFAYRVFANWRFARLSHCQVALADEKQKVQA